jgi:Rrf2 family transcriptional regulator, iron-sulfur cluster assembly transcription factor
LKLSTRSRYGTRLMLDMAHHYDQGPVQLGTIAKRQNIPVKYLEQIIIPLKKANYVRSVRGNRGGHMLAKSPAEITVGEIVSLLEGGIKLTDCTESPQRCERSATCVTRLLWKEATEAIHEKFKSITLADLVRIEKGNHHHDGRLNCLEQEQGNT